MKERQEFIKIYQNSIQKFGLENTKELTQIILSTMPKKRYRTMKGINTYLKREINSLYNTREENRKNKEIKKKYEHWKL